MINVVIVMANECASSSVTSAVDIFTFANQIHQSQSGTNATHFKTVTVSWTGEQVAGLGGLILSPQAKAEAIEHADIILFPGFMQQIFSELPNLVSYHNWIKYHYQRGAYICSMCTGSFILAESGILDDKLATTHWHYARHFSKAYPQIKLNEKLILTEDQRVICAGGATAANDLILLLVEKFVSKELAYECSKILLINTARRSQSEYILTHFYRNHSDTSIGKVQDWLEDHFSENFSIEQVAQNFGFGERQFKRRFKRATSETPISYIQKLRVEFTKKQLALTNQNFETITFDAGYSDANSYRRLFKTTTGLTPSTYRKKFDQCSA
ncbi:MAG: transcriptional regulator GlxA family with amidase domain [Oleiphilaceae bacterium]|jgi:transcriptional regulator GlxA family with amidase domain